MTALRLSGALALLFWSHACFAAVAPEPGAGDPRMQIVHYVPEEVVELHATIGYVTTIEFGDGEHMENIAIGNSLGWQITPNKRANLLFVKPFQHHPVTNMTVITNLHRYDFSLKAEEPAPRGSGGHTAVFGIRFVYPAPEPVQETVVLKPAKPVEPELPKVQNNKYTYQGSRDLIPARVFDDGQFTYFQFAKDEDYPAIYVVGLDGKESVMNFSVRQGFIVVDKIAPAFLLRRGAVVAKIFNDGFKGPVITADSPKPKTKGWFQK
jgi:type IV secretion system protein VirB9